MGLEAYERGAFAVVEVELLQKRAAAIRKNIRIGMENNYIVLSMDIRRALQWLEKKNYSFDIIFADPPYEEGWPRKILQLLKERNSIIKNEGDIIIEHSIHEPLDILEGDFVVIDRRTYGDTILTFLKKKEAIS